VTGRRDDQSPAGVERTIRERCLTLPSVTERLSHGAPTFFIREKSSFAAIRMEGHHDLDFPHLLCAAPPGVQARLVDARPEVFFVPAYVGGRGWIGARLDRDLSAREAGDLCEDGYRCVAPRRLLAELDGA
jgi:hypothetical protein